MDIRSWNGFVDDVDIGDHEEHEEASTRDTTPLPFSKTQSALFCVRVVELLNPNTRLPKVIF